LDIFLAPLMVSTPALAVFVRLETFGVRYKPTSNHLATINSA
jgi:hypothetical protein